MFCVHVDVELRQPHIPVCKLKLPETQTETLSQGVCFIIAPSGDSSVLGSLYRRRGRGRVAETCDAQKSLGCPRGRRQPPRGGLADA